MNLENFDRLPPILRQAIARQNLENGQRLFRQGDLANNLFAIATGRLRLVRHNRVKNLVTILVNKIEWLKRNLELRGIRVSEQRVLQYLRYPTTPDDNVVSLNRSLKEIAVELGFTPETLSRALAKLEQDGLISPQSDEILLYDSAADKRSLNLCIAMNYLLTIIVLKSSAKIEAALCWMLKVIIPPSEVRQQH